jgi:ABC-type nitrate/sulfonate/bicarbonate transport system substrate-binding protein
MHRFQFRLLATALFAATTLMSFAVADFIGTASAQTVQKTKLKIAFPTSPHAFALPHFVAMEKGWLSEAGLDVEEQWLIGDTTVIRLIVTGEADMCVTGLPAAFSAVAAGAQVKAIGSQQVIFDFQMVTNKSITKVADLAGKRFAAGPPLSIQTEVPRVIMRKYGLDPEKVQFQQAGGTPDRLQAVVGGVADATLIGTSFALQAAAKYPNVHVLTTVPKEFPGMGFSYVMATTKALADPAKKKAMEAYIEQSTIRASRFIMDNPEEAVKILLKRVPSLDPEIAKQSVADLNKDNVWGVNGGLDREVTDFTIKFSLESKMIPSPVTYEQVVDPSLVNAALARAGKR